MTDDTAAFLAANDAAWAAGGGIVFIPASDHCYRVQMTIDDDAAYNCSPRVTWKGAGAFASRLMAVDAGEYAITVTGGSQWEWGWAFEDIGFVGGGYEGVMARTRGGIRFADPTPTVSNVQFSRCSFFNCTYGFKTEGPLFYHFDFCTFCRNDYGVHIMGCSAPMHGGCAFFDNCNWYINYLAAFYLNGEALNVEQAVVRGGVNESNQGFGFFIKSTDDTFPFVIEDVYTENNGIASTVEIDGVAYTVNSTGMHFEDCPRVDLIRTKMIWQPDVDNSVVYAYQPWIYSGSDYPAEPNVTNNGRIVLVDPYIDSRLTLPPEMVVTGTVDVPESTTRWANYVTPDAGPAVYDATNLLTGGSMATLSIVANAYGKTYSFIDGDAPRHGRYLSATLPQSASWLNSFMLFQNVPTTENKWYVWSCDIRSGGNDADFRLEWITSLGAANMHTRADRWLHYRGIQKAPSTQSTADLYIYNTDADAETVHLANMQLVEFDTKEEALAYLNAGKYAVIGSGWMPPWYHDLSRVFAVSADVTDFSDFGTTIINSRGGAITGTLPDGTYRGQRVKFVCKAAGNNIDIEVLRHAASKREVIRLDAAKEWVELVWDGTDWVETGGMGQTYP